MARVRIAYTGRETAYGEIVRTAVEGTLKRTPLQQAVAELVRVLLAVALVICLVLALTRLWQGHGMLDAILSAVTLAVAALPEEFPVVLTFFWGWACSGWRGAGLWSGVRWRWRTSAG